MKTFLKQNFHYIFFTLLGLIILSSCKKEDNGHPDGMGDPTKARVNVIHASHDAGPVRLFINDGLFVTGLLNYGRATGYYSADPGNIDLDIMSEDNILLTGMRKNLEANENYTILVSRQLGKQVLTTITDDWELPAKGKAKIRFVNTLFNSHGVSLNSGKDVLVALNDYMSAAPSSMEVSAKTYMLSVSSGNYKSIPKAIALEAGKIYTIYTMGSVSGSGNSALEMGVFKNR